MLIPNDLLTDFKQTTRSQKPTIALRALSTLDNKLGETYFLCGRNSVLLYSGRLGQKKERREFNYEEIVSSKISKKQAFVFLELEIPGGPVVLKFAQFDTVKLNRFLKSCSQRSKVADDDKAKVMEAISPIAEEADDPDEHEVPELTPMIGFSAALHAMVYIDDDAADDELRNLKIVIPDPSVIRQGYLYFKESGTTELIARLKDMLDDRAKRCLLANLVETSMVDGSIRTKEQEFLEFVRLNFDIDGSELKNWFDVLLLKNDTGVFA